MIDEKALYTLEFNKIRDRLSSYCVLAGGKRKALSMLSEKDFESAQISLSKTEEAFGLLFDRGASGIEFYDDLGDAIERAATGATLSPAELLRVARLLKSARIVYSSASGEDEERFPLLRGIATGIYFDAYLENEIKSKILSEDAISDNASDRLYEIRRKIKRINEQIREKLAAFIRDGNNKYLQENIITMRRDRYVLPVKSEYKNQFGGFVHDQSSTGSTVFIEPTVVLELNNSLRMATIEEQDEIEKILYDMSQKVRVIAERLSFDEDILTELDLIYAKAIYAYKTKSTKPLLNRNGIIKIIKGRHPLIDPKKVVPVSVEFGEDYNFLLVTGPNTGGKTVTLKMTGLMSVMAACGMFIPAAGGSDICFFDNIFCDVGDDQSIEENLSTFSSHIKNIVYITENVSENSLVLIDEIGAGTDPDEGSALSRAIIEYLLCKNCRGIITTHYSKLKEFAYTEPKLKNAAMEFDTETFAPLYKINIGMPGSSNAIEISGALGLKESLTRRASSLLGDDKVSFETVIREAEKARRAAESETERLSALRLEEEQKIAKIDEELKKLEREKQKFYTGAKAEARRLVNERIEEADEIIDEIKVLFDKAEIGSGDLIKARTLRNKLEDKKYSLDENEVTLTNYLPVEADKLKVGDSVYYKPMDCVCKVNSVNAKKGKCDISMGSINMIVALKDLFFVSKAQKPKQTVSLKRPLNGEAVREINVIGQTVGEAIPEIERFIDGAIISNLEEVKIIHGKGLKILSKAIHDYLRKNKNVESYRFGKYGEGEHGVTFVKLK